MMSPNRLVVTMMSNCSGRITSCMQVLSTIISLHWMSGYCAATSRATFRNRPDVTLQDVGLVHHGDLLAAGLAGQVEGVAHDALGALAGDLLRQQRGFAVFRDRLAFTDVRALGVLAHGDQVHARREARLGVRERLGRTHVGVQVEVAAQGHVDRTEALAHRRGQRALQGHTIPADGIQRGLGQQVTVLFQRDEAGIGVFIGQADLEGVEHVQGGVHDLRANTVAADDRNRLGH